MRSCGGLIVLSTCSEPRLDFFHQRAIKLRFAHRVEILQNEALSGPPAVHLLATIAQIKRSCLVRAVEEHERMSAVDVGQRCIWHSADCEIGSIECLREITVQ